MEKLYGKLSAEQFERTVAQLPELKKSMEELPELLRTATSGKVRAALEEGIFSAPMYELPMSKHAAFGLYVLEQKDKILEIAKEQDPQEAFLRFIESEEGIGQKGADGEELDLGSVFLLT